MTGKIWKTLAAGLLLAALSLGMTGLASAEGKNAETADTNGIPVVSIYNTGWNDTSVYIPGSIEFRDADGSFLLADESASWRCRGNTSLEVAKKSFKIKLSGDFDLYGMGSSDKWNLLANAMDKTLLRNKLMLDLGDYLNLEFNPKSTFVDVYLHGSYLGNYLMTESLEVSGDRMDLDMARGEYAFELFCDDRTPSGPYFRTPLYKLKLEVTDLAYLSGETKACLLDFFQQAEEAIQSGDREEIEKYVDIPSFVRTYLVYEFSKNPDLNYASTRFYIKEGKLYSGPLWDFDLSCGDDAPEPDADHKINGTIPARTDGWYAVTLYWHDLTQQDWFLELFAEEYRNAQPFLVNLYEDNELGENRIDALVETMADSIAQNYSVWSVYGREYHLERRGEATYEENVEFLRTWLKERNEWLLQQIDAGGKFIVLNEEIA